MRGNALKHGLLAREIVISEGPGKESPQEFENLVSDLVDHFKPSGPIEGMLVERIAQGYWRLRRAARSEAGEITSAVSRDPETRYDDDDLDELELLFKRRQLRSSVRGVRFLLSNIRQLRIHLAPMLYARIRESCPPSGSYG